MIIINKKRILKDYTEKLISEDKAENTIETYTSNVEKFLKWLKERYGEYSPVNITIIDLKEYQNYLLKIKKYEVSGVKQRMYSIFSYCDFLHSKDYIDKNIKYDIKLIKSQNSNLNIINKNQLNLFRREVYKSNNIRDIAIVETLINTGIRVSELINIELDDIDISERKGLLKIREGKGKKARDIPLNKQARKSIYNYIQVRVNENVNKVWLGQRGALTRDGINKMLKKYASRISLEDIIHPHIFRHYLARYLLRVRKVDPILVADILGHSNINTLKIYTQPTLEEKATTLENINL